MKPKILVIVSTTREGRSGRKIADWYIAQAQKASSDLDFELYDIVDLQLPVFHEATPPMMHQYSDIQSKIEASLNAADGFVFVTGEYNHSVPGSLKNFLDHTYSGWQRKVAAYVGYGGLGGVRAVEHLIGIMSFFDVANLVEQVNITQAWKALGEDGIPKNEFVMGDIAKQVAELSWWAKTLKAGRQQ
jgi:NAD(P)H-dependent FMN reductase